MVTVGALGICLISAIIELVMLAKVIIDIIKGTKTDTKGPVLIILKRQIQAQETE